LTNINTQSNINTNVNSNHQDVFQALLQVDAQEGQADSDDRGEKDAEGAEARGKGSES